MEPYLLPFTHGELGVSPCTLGSVWLCPGVTSGTGVTLHTWNGLQPPCMASAVIAPWVLGIPHAGKGLKPRIQSCDRPASNGLTWIRLLERNLRARSDDAQSYARSRSQYTRIGMPNK